VIREKIWKIYRAIEGTWKDGTYQSGGFKLTSIRGEAHYPLTPMQAYTYAYIYGPHHYVDLGVAPRNVVLMPSECINPNNGHLLDLRRVCRFVIVFVPRKNAKSDLSSNLAIIDFFFGDTNGDVMLCSNSQDQSAIIFNMIKDKLHQLDPQEQRIRFTTKELNWKKFEKRHNVIESMSAGGKTKDGHFASLVLEDEFGSATYVNGHSDMASLCQVCESSMGPRAQPLVVITTTAGNSINGPFQMKLENEKQDLIREILTAYQQLCA
jgi:hypothetical protein